jgi:hypothetical protein
MRLALRVRPGADGRESTSVSTFSAGVDEGLVEKANHLANEVAAVVS